MSAVGTLQAAGLALRTDGEQLYVEPRERITADLRDYIREHKQAILVELATEARRAKVEARLRADQKLRIAADVADAPLRPEPGRPISIMLGVRTTAGIVTGELQAPRDRFDAALFLAYLDQIPEIPS